MDKMWNFAYPIMQKAVALFISGRVGVGATKCS